MIKYLYMMKRIWAAVFLMGFTSLVAQTMAIREFLVTFYGNEFTIGIIFANWIVLGAAGSLAASRFRGRLARAETVYALLQAGLALYLPVSIFLIRSVKDSLGLVTGEGVGILPVFASSLLILAPLGLMTGAQFPIGSVMLSRATGRPARSAGFVYALEGAGFMLAGPVFTYLFIPYFNSFSAFFLVGALNVASAISLVMKEWRKAGGLFLTLALTAIFVFTASSIFFLSGNLNTLSIARQWKGRDVIDYRNSVYGNLAVSRSGGQYTFYSNGIPVIASPTPDITSVEERAHFTMLAADRPGKVLLIGGAGGVIREVLKYPVREVTYVELDPSLIRMVQKFPTALTAEELGDKRVHIHYIDGRRFLRTVKEKYDVIIHDLPMPSTLELNRFYTERFFSDVRERLADGGVFSFTLPGSLSYISPEQGRLNSSIMGTLKRALKVSVIPGDNNLYIASKVEPKVDAGAYLLRIEGYGIRTALMNRRYFEHRLDPKVRGWFMDEISRYSGARKNTDLVPSGTFYSVWYWAALFSRGAGGLFASVDRLNIFTLFIALTLAWAGLAAYGAFRPGSGKLCSCYLLGTTGFAGMSLSLIIIYAYQSFYGFVFHQIAMLVTAFMVGLAAGSYFMNRGINSVKNDRLAFLIIETACLGFSIAMIPALLYSSARPAPELAWSFFILSCMAGSFIGLEFPLANRMYASGGSASSSPGILYAVDLAGSWLAALMVSAALVPVIGMVMTCVFIAGIKVSSLGLLVISLGVNSRRRV